MTTDKMRPWGVVGAVHRYHVIVVGDHLEVICSDDLLARKNVPGLRQFRTKAKDLWCGWQQRADGIEVVYVYDRADRAFGYAVHLEHPELNRWGCAPVVE